jgi:hypothetical protein
MMIGSLRVNDRWIDIDDDYNRIGLLTLLTSRALQTAVEQPRRFERAVQHWARETHCCAHVIIVVNVAPAMTSRASTRIVLAPVATLARLRFLEAWNATVGGAFSTLAYTHRQRTRSKPIWAATARAYAQRQFALARVACDGELQFKCCVWLAYAECYDWRFHRARRWLSALRRLLRRDSAVRELVGAENVDSLGKMVRHALHYVDAIERHTCNV